MTIDFTSYYNDPNGAVRDDIHTQYGAEGEQAARWQRIVNKLDVSYPGWRRGRFLGDAAVSAIHSLTEPFREKAEAQRRVEEAKDALAKAEAKLKALS